MDMDMDMSGMTATAGDAVASATGAAAAASSTTSSMSMSSTGCKISMLWNWNTIDACFISSHWKITSKGMFAGSCIGVILLVIALEFLRRVGKEYDRAILKKFKSSQQTMRAPGVESGGSSTSIAKDVSVAPPTPMSWFHGEGEFRPSLFQQIIRAFLHMLTFGTAYFVMLLAMYYNGYIIISIFIGAFIGSFIFSWEAISIGIGPRIEATVCCG